MKKPLLLLGSTLFTLLSCSQSDDFDNLTITKNAYSNTSAKMENKSVDSTLVNNFDNKFQPVVIKRYYSSYHNKHYFGSFCPIPSFFLEGALGVTSQDWTGPIITSWFNEKNGDSFLTQNPKEVEGKAGWIRKENLGYSCSPRSYGSYPIYRYYRSKTNSHFYTKDWSELGEGRMGFVYEGIAFYLR